MNTLKQGVACTVGKVRRPATPARDPLERSLIGPAGEHFVLYQLYRRGLLAALAPPGVPEVDILILDQHKTVRVGVQVKTPLASMAAPVGGFTSA